MFRKIRQVLVKIFFVRCKECGERAGSNYTTCSSCEEYSIQT
jgi:lipopolysaccharide biosynthesis regulator YciM